MRTLGGRYARQGPCKMTPMSFGLPSFPTAQTFDPLPQTPNRFMIPPPGTLAHAMPFQCRMVPFIPTTQMSVGPPPKTLVSCCVVPLEAVSQALPFHRKIVPLWPTAHTSLAPLPQTLVRRVVVPLGTAIHAVPAQ